MIEICQFIYVVAVMAGRFLIFFWDRKLILMNSMNSLPSNVKNLIRTKTAREIQLI